MILFFLPDEFIADVLKSKAKPIHKPDKKYEPLIPLIIILMFRLSSNP
jgi:hypothetical protein